MSSSENQQNSKNHSELCQICGKKFSTKNLFHCSLIKNGILSEIKQHHPNWDGSGYICEQDLDNFRANYIKNLILEEQGALSRLDEEVIQSYRDQELVTENINKQVLEEMTFGEKIADRVASFGGSWTFLFSFFIVIVFWIILNILFLSRKAFDPYPFILLNLILSCLAAVQAPVIMMSQNRQAKKDKIKSDYEYMINLKAELEIKHINSKIDQLMREQWKRMLDIQNIQIDLMEEIKKNLRK